MVWSWPEGLVIPLTPAKQNATPRVTFEKLLDSAAPQPPEVGETIDKLESTFHGMKFHARVTEPPDLRAWLGDEPDVRQLANFRLHPQSITSFRHSRTPAKADSSRIPSFMIRFPPVLDTMCLPRAAHRVCVDLIRTPQASARDVGRRSRFRGTTPHRPLLTSYAPNFRQSITDYTLFTPDDLEGRIGMIAGNINHIHQGVGQLLGDRLFAGGGHRTPVPGLYMCGAGTHPGGSVTGAPGYNAARVVLTDLN